MYRRYLEMNFKAVVGNGEDNSLGCHSISNLPNDTDTDTDKISERNLEGADEFLTQTDRSSSNLKFNHRPILPNLPYSPLASPHGSPVHRLRPQNTFHMQHNSCNLSFLQRENRSVSVTEGTDGIIHLNQYNILQQLGQGSYGLVQLAYNKEDSTYYALKILSRRKLMKSSGLFNKPPPIRKSTSSISSSGFKSTNQSADAMHKIYREIAIHKKLHHQNIVSLIEVLDDPSEEFLYMVFEYVERGPVMTIGKDEPFSETVARKYFTDTLLGLEYLHYQKIIHRDIKPSNLLLSKQDQIKISDFGVSNEFVGDDVYLATSAGSPAFMAPESVRDGEECFAGKALDIWALGITLYAFLYGSVPFENFNRYLLYQMIINNPVPYPDAPKLSKEVLDLLQKMLDKQPLTRIKLNDMKTHPWVTDNGQIRLLSQAENCGQKCVNVTEDEVANSVLRMPKMETVIKIKMILKHKTFKNPLKCGSMSKVNDPSAINDQDDNKVTTHEPSPKPISVSPIHEDIINKQNNKESIED